MSDVTYEQGALFPEPDREPEPEVICLVVHPGPCPPIGGHR